MHWELGQCFKILHDEIYQITRRPLLQMRHMCVLIEISGHRK